MAYSRKFLKLFKVTFDNEHLKYEDAASLIDNIENDRFLTEIVNENVGIHDSEPRIPEINYIAAFEKSEVHDLLESFVSSNDALITMKHALNDIEHCEVMPHMNEHYVPHARLVVQNERSDETCQKTAKEIMGEYELLSSIQHDKSLDLMTFNRLCELLQP